MSIQAIITDIDGVIIGDKSGHNMPHPHPDVLAQMRQTTARGLPIILSTARACFGITDIARAADLNNLHIADGGAVILNPISGDIVEKHIITPDLALAVLQSMTAESAFTELYTISSYYVQDNQICGEMTEHGKILQHKPTIVANIIDECPAHEIIKILFFVTPDVVPHTNATLSQFGDQIAVSWTVHPALLPLQVAVVTASGISKRCAAQKIAQNQNIDMKNILGIGDTMNDWSFIELCGYGAAPANAAPELKERILAKGPDNSFIGPSVDDNGMIEILNFATKNIS